LLGFSKVPPPLLCHSVFVSVRLKNMMWLMGRKIWGTFPDSANKASFV